MPPNPGDIATDRAWLVAEVERLRDDNAKLRALVDHLCGEIKKIAAELGKLIDKDIH
jgi:hypothetical protein